MSTPNLSIFDFDSNSVRTVVREEDGAIALCLTDLLRAMHSKTHTPEAKSLIEETFGEGYVINVPLQTNGGIQDILFVLESGATFLLSRSRTEAGKRLNRLIHTEILPSIRKTGKYQVVSVKDDIELANLAIALAFAGTSIKPEIEAQFKLQASIAIAPHLASALAPAQQALINSTAQEFQLLTATDIGKRLGISGQAINKLLIEKGFQTKNTARKSKKEPSYLPTDRGAEFADLTLSAGKDNDRSTYQQLRWYESILNAIA